MYHYSKKLLLELTIDHAHPIFDDLRLNQPQKTYDKRKIQGFDFVNDDIDYIFIESIEENKFLITYLNQTYFDLAKRLTILTSHLLRDKLNHLSLHLKKNKEINALKNLLDFKGQGVFKLHQNQVIPMNHQAKQWLGENLKMLTYEDFQLSLEPKLYIDQLTNQNRFDVSYRGTPYELITTTIDYELYLLLEKQRPKEQVAKEDWQIHPSHSICLIDMHNHDDMIEQLGYQAYHKQLLTFIDVLPKLSNHHLLDLVVEANHMIYLLLDTRDKRLFDRIFEKANHLLGDSYDLRFSYLPFNSDINTMKDKLLYLLSLTSNVEPKHITEKILRLNEEKSHLYLQTIQSLIKNKQVKLIDHLVKDWQTQTTRYHVIEVDDLNVLTDKALLKQIFQREDLAILFDRLVVNQVLAKVKDIHDISTWFIPLTKASIQSKKALNYLFRRFDLAKQHHFILMMDYPSYQSLSKSDKQYLKEKDIDLCLIHYPIDMNQLMVIHPIDYVIIEPNLFEHEFTKEIIDMLKKRFKTLIYDHQDQQLLKAKLQSLKIDLVMGEFSGRKFL
jgi:hypothetical protein